MCQKFIVMNTCRTCLNSPANKNISELGKGIDDDNKQCADIMAFCLDIKVTEDSKITTNLCYNCYRKIISFYKFKTLSLKNDEYLRSLDDVQLKDQKNSFYVDENGIKHENFLEPDDYGPNLVEGNTEIRKEINLNELPLGNVKIDDVDVKYEETLGDTQTYDEDYNILDEEILGDSQTYEDHDTIQIVPSDGCRDGGDPCSDGEDIKGTAPICEKLSSKKKLPHQAAKKVKQQKDNVEKVKLPHQAAKKVKQQKDNVEKVLEPKYKKRSSKKPQIQVAKKIKDQKENEKMQGPHICEQCGVSVIDIKSHSLTHKFKDERKMLQCKACPKLFVSRGGRRRHFIIHHLGRKPKCDICNGCKFRINN